MGAHHVTEDIFKITLPTPFPVGDVNLFLVKGEALTLVDAGVKTEEAWSMFTKQLKTLGFSLSDIDQVVLTHHHPDHVGLLDYFNKDIPIIGHPYNQPWISRDEQFFQAHDEFIKKMLTQSGIDPRYLNPAANLKKSLRYSCTRSLTMEIVEGDPLIGLPEWRVIETPGHAQSHIVLYRERDGVVIGGDLLLSKISPNPLLEPPQSDQNDRPKPQVQYTASLKKLLSLDISRVLTGHGDDVTDAHQLIHKRLDKQRERANHVVDLLKQKPMTAFEVCQQIFPTMYQKELLLTMSGTIGQLDFLGDLGEIKVDASKQQYLYYIEE